MNSACHCADVSFATAGSTSFGRMCAQPVSHCVCGAWLRKGWADSTNRAGPKPMRLEIQSLARCCLALLGMRTPVDRARCSESTAVLGLGECWGRARSAIERVQTDRDTTRRGRSAAHARAGILYGQREVVAPCDTTAAHSGEIAGMLQTKSTIV